MKYTILFFFLILIQNLYAQNLSIESLQDSIDFYFTINAKKTEYFVKTKKEILEKEENWKEHETATAYLIASYYYAKEFNKAKKSLDNLFIDFEKHQTSKKSSNYGNALNLYGVIANEMYNHKKAIYYFKEALKIELPLGDAEDLFFRYWNLCQLYITIGDYEKTIDNLKKANKLAPNEDWSIRANQTFAEVYQKQKKSPLLIKKHFNDALKQFHRLDNISKAYNDHSILFFSLANFHESIGEYDKALYYIDLRANKIDLTSDGISTNHELLSSIYWNRDRNLELALQNINKTIQLRKETKQFKDIVLARALRIKAEYYFEAQDYKNALQFYQETIIELIPNFNTFNPSSNPTLNKISDKQKLLTALKGKAKTLYYLNRYEEALTVYNLCNDLMDQMRLDYEGIGSKFFLIDEAKVIYEDAIANALKIDDYQSAFSFAEKSKAILLLESSRDQKAKHNVPDSLTLKESDFKIDIAFYERQIWKEEQKDSLANQETIEKWKDIVIDLKFELDTLKDLLKKDYPQYYKEQYDASIASVQDIQKQLLTKNHAHLSYFIGEEKGYLFAITKHDIQVFPLQEVQAIDSLVALMRQSLEQSIVGKKGAVNYYENAFKIYQNYLAPAIEKLPSTINKLTILADGHLNYIPFEALLTSMPTFDGPRYEIQQLDYLIKKYQIAYAYSATLLLENLDLKPNKNLKTFGGFAPSFAGEASDRRGCDGDVLGQLAFGRDNISAIRSIIGEGSDVFFDDDANAQSFKESVDDYKILHLCTHACSEEDFKNTRIYFSDQELLGFELYEMPMKAQLAVLSACETGIGELKQGEGVMSLARALSYSGCPSVVTSLWSVDDKSTSELMKSFYTHLKSGMDKDEALHHAKLDYLNGKGIEASHPFYWSGFVQVGTTEALFKKELNWLWFAGGGLLFFVAAAWFKARRKNAAKAA